LTKPFALISAFVLGVMLTLCIQKLYLRIAAAPVFAQASAVPQQRGSENSMLSIFGMNPASVPAYADISRNGKISNLNFKNAQQILDGLRCNDCSFTDTELNYSGGPFELKNTRFSGTTHVILSGAAANTSELLKLLNGIGTGKPPIPNSQNERPKQKARAKKPVVVTFSATFIGGH
jgi:hypothetical protein